MVRESRESRSVGWSRSLGKVNASSKNRMLLEQCGQFHGHCDFIFCLQGQHNEPF